MFLTDTHTHLFAAEFDADRSELINEAISHGVQRYYLPNIEESTVEPMLKLCRQFPDHCRPMIGLHPCSVKENYKEQLEQIFSWLDKEKFAAIGEIGIDMFWDKSLAEQQIEAFRIQVKKAVELDLPIAIHSRDSFDIIIDVLKQLAEEMSWEKNRIKGIFHCFTGSLQQAEQAMNLGFYLGIGGVLTFKNSGLDKVVKDLPMESLLLETDAPYLAPAPHRGKRNIPEYLVLVAEKISDIKNIPVEEVARITSENAQKLFRW